MSDASTHYPSFRLPRQRDERPQALYLYLVDVADESGFLPSLRINESLTEAAGVARLRITAVTDYLISYGVMWREDQDTHRRWRVVVADSLDQALHMAWSTCTELRVVEAAHRRLQARLAELHEEYRRAHMAMTLANLRAGRLRAGG